MSTYVLKAEGHVLPLLELCLGCMSFLEQGGRHKYKCMWRILRKIEKSFVTFDFSYKNISGRTTNCLP